MRKGFAQQHAPACHTPAGFGQCAVSSHEVVTNNAVAVEIDQIAAMGPTCAGHPRAYALASSRAHVILGHDPLVLKRYPAPSRAFEGMVTRLDVEPSAA